MIIMTKRIPYKTGKKITIIPIFDAHVGNKLFDEPALRKDLKMADAPDTYIIGGGDIMDSVITSDIKRYKKSIDASEGDDILDQQINKAYELLLPYREKIIIMHEGNHEENITKRCGTNPMKRLCSLLEVPFGGYSSLLRLVFYRSDNNGCSRSLIIRTHHGWGGGSRTQGADLTKFSKDMNYWDADIFLYGHVHKKQDDIIPRLGLVGNKLVAKPRIICLCGTYLKTFTLDTNASYSEVNGYPPTQIGCQTISILPDAHGWLDMKVNE